MDPKKSNVGTGLVGAPACGDVMKLQIEVIVHFNEGCTGEFTCRYTFNLKLSCKCIEIPVYTLQLIFCVLFKILNECNFFVNFLLKLSEHLH